MDSILQNTKKLLGIGIDDTAFDEDVITNINGAFLNLMQLGVGPVTGFSISDETDTWTTFSTNRNIIEAAKMYVYLKTRLIFDPPANSTVADSIRNQIAELEWRLNVESEGDVAGAVS